MGFSTQEYWSGLLAFLQGNLPDPGAELLSLVCPALQVVLYHYATCEVLTVTLEQPEWITLWARTFQGSSGSSFLLRWCSGYSPRVSLTPQQV